MVVTCCYLSPLSSLAETVAGKETTSGSTEPQVDQFLSAMTYCVTSGFGAAELMSGKRQEKEVGCANRFDVRERS
jgi:hypothetical protein